MEPPSELEVTTLPRLSKRAPKKKKKQVMRREMHKYKHGTLHSGSKRGPIVQSRKQAIAIGLSEAGMSKKRRKKRSRRKR